MSTNKFLWSFIRSILINNGRRSRLNRFLLSLSSLLALLSFLSFSLAGLLTLGMTASDNHLLPTDNTYPIAQPSYIFLRRIRVLSIHIPSSSPIPYQVGNARDERSESHPYVPENMEGDAVIEEYYRKEYEVGQEFREIYTSAFRFCAWRRGEWRVDALTG
jgi:hypothetical protein